MSAPTPRRREREEMVERLHLTNARVADALRRVLRHEFVPAAARAESYDDTPVALGYGDATASAPHMVALMLEEADLREGQRVMEIGGGMGYFAAVAAELVGPTGHVDTIELDPGLAREADRRLAHQGYADRVTVFAQDGATGLPDRAPFDVIVVSCAAPELLPAWTAQLRDGGRLVAPIGDRYEQVLVTYVREGVGGSTRWGPACRFVPLRRRPVPHI
ncbi:MAG: methyltransferase domain-containing protein [Thermoplasmata archaeon]|nr:methyltransferase domain-containing protein [Thermoplasmata archaeon]